MSDSGRNFGRGKQRQRQESGPRVVVPLSGPRLEELGLAYVARFATSAGKLRHYLLGKLRQRGWVEDNSSAGHDQDADSARAEGAARIEALVERFVAAGYVDDESFARGRTGGLLRRGFGKRRIVEALGAAGIDADLRERVLPGEGAQRGAALALARKRRFGPFGDAPPDPARCNKQVAAMLRAGHGAEAARRLVMAITPEEAEEWAQEVEDDDSPDM